MALFLEGLGHPRFNEKKATQLAARILKGAGKPYAYLSLIKLVYLIDREAFNRRGVAVSTDVYFSLPHGPVVSGIMSLAKGESFTEQGFWSRHIARSEQYDIELTESAGEDELSEFEMALADEVFAEYGRKSWTELRDLVHDFPEYVEPSEDKHGERRVRLSIEDILRGLQKTDEEVEQAQERLKARALLDSLQ